MNTNHDNTPNTPPQGGSTLAETDQEDTYTAVDSEGDGDDASGDNDTRALLITGAILAVVALLAIAGVVWLFRAGTAPTDTGEVVLPEDATTAAPTTAHNDGGQSDRNQGSESNRPSGPARPGDVEAEGLRANEYPFPTTLFYSFDQDFLNPNFVQPPADDDGTRAIRESVTSMLERMPATNGDPNDPATVEAINIFGHGDAGIARIYATAVQQGWRIANVGVFTNANGNDVPDRVVYEIVDDTGAVLAVFGGHYNPVFGSVAVETMSVTDAGMATGLFGVS